MGMTSTDSDLLSASTLGAFTISGTISFQPRVHQVFSHLLPVTVFKVHVLFLASVVIWKKLNKSLVRFLWFLSALCHILKLVREHYLNWILNTTEFGISQ